MSELALMVGVGLAIAAAMVALGAWHGKRARSSPRGQWAAHHGWCYEGFDTWTHQAPPDYMWRAGQKAEERDPGSDVSIPVLRFDATLFQPTGLQILIAPREDFASMPKGNSWQPFALDREAFAERLVAVSNSPALAQRVCDQAWAAHWRSWPGRTFTGLLVRVDDQAVSIQIPGRTFAGDGEAEYFLLFGERLLKNILALR